MSDIILSTLNAKYIHTAFGLRYLYANLGELQANARLQEFTIANRPIDIAEKLLVHEPKIIGFSVYIWNITETTALVALLKQVAPQVKIVLGGPEVSHETNDQLIIKMADYVITGAGEVSFKQLCEQILAGLAPLNNVLEGIAIPLDELKLPYDDYSQEDIETRVVYVEASRGCPFKCEFCLSSLDKTAKPFELGRFLDEMEKLYNRGLRHFKFIDRTFNLKVKTTIAILEFFLDHLDDEIFLHFELIPDHLPDVLKEVIQRFPVGSLQFEIGIQTFDPPVQQLISRKQDNEKSKANLKWLREESNAHLHTDLIFGLPGEDLDSFAESFTQLVALNPHEIQLGILKRLRGSPIIRHTEKYQLVFNPLPPYNILSTDRVDFKTMQQVNRFARYWDMVGNSGKFSMTLPLLLGDEPFQNFWIFSQSLYARSQQTHKISLKRLFDFVYEIAIEDVGLNQSFVKESLKKDFDASLMKGVPEYLRDQVANASTLPKSRKMHTRNKRQVSHLR
ncbi:MAG: DUF4080 domain-containing protein [Thiotrichaceae bacterium]